MKTFLDEIPKVPKSAFSDLKDAELSDLESTDSGSGSERGIFPVHPPTTLATSSGDRASISGDQASNGHSTFLKSIPSISDTLYLVMCVCVGGGLEMGAKKFVLSCILLFDVMHGYTLGMS